MQERSTSKQEPFGPIENPLQLIVLNEMGRSVNIITTYGLHHPAAEKAIKSTVDAVHKLLENENKFTLGIFNGVMTVNEVPIKSSGTLQKSLERRLIRLNITGLVFKQGITKEEISKLTELLSLNESSDFEKEFQKAPFSNINNESTSYQAVRDGQTVTDANELNAGGGNGVLVLDDTDLCEHNKPAANQPVHVEQIVAFIQGDTELDNDALKKDLIKAASDPDHLGQMIMESVAIRQTAAELNGESLGDIVIGCLRRTFTGLRKQPLFESPEGVASLHKALLMLEESVLEKIHDLSGAEDPELDRQIVQAVRHMEEGLTFEIAAQEYVGHRRGLEESQKSLQAFIHTHGAEEAANILENTAFPSADWRKIVVQSNCLNAAGGADGNKNAAIHGINSLAKVFEKLETLMKSEDSCGSQMKNLLGEASDNLGDTIHSTREKLGTLSRQLKEDTGTIGGQAQGMSRKELLSSIAEVAQELMQPLTAIRASIDMMLEGFVGEVSADQRDILGLAVNSIEHLRFLMNELINIVGCPTNKGVDERFHTTSDEVLLMNNPPAA